MPHFNVYIMYIIQTATTAAPAASTSALFNWKLANLFMLIATPKDYGLLDRDDLQARRRPLAQQCRRTEGKQNQTQILYMYI